MTLAKYHFTFRQGAMNRKRTTEATRSKRGCHKNAGFERLLQAVDRRLTMEGDNPHGNHKDPLDELVFIILSAQTESYLYHQTFRDLKAAYTPWEKLLIASEVEIASIIRSGGLARKKAAQLKAAFRQIKKTQGKLSLQFLKNLSDEAAFRYLDALPGIGMKSAKCVMMYSLKRAVFPVDTHVWRIARRLGIAPPVAKPSEAQQHCLEAKIPEKIRFSLHVKFVSLGQQQCTTYFPKCTTCPLSDLCPSNGRRDKVWSDWSQPKGVWATVDSRSGQCEVRS